MVRSKHSKYFTEIIPFMAPFDQEVGAIVVFNFTVRKLGPMSNESRD